MKKSTFVSQQNADGSVTQVRVVRDMTPDEMTADLYQPTEADVRAEGQRRLEALAAPYGTAERETWREQIAEAEARILAPLTAAPMLAAIAAGRGMTTDQMAVRVLALRDQFRAASAAVLAAQGALIALDPIPQDFADDAHWP